MGRTRVHYILFLTCILFPDVRSEVTCKWTDSIPSEGDCFIYNATKVSYAEAKASCKSIGGVLAKLKTKTQMLEATDIVPDETSIWIGANDKAVEGTWIWEDGGVATELYDLWDSHQNQPSNKTDTEDCADISIEFAVSGIWDDECDKQYPFLCMEKDEITTPDPEASIYKTNDPPTTEPTTNDPATTVATTNDPATTEATTNDHDTTEPPTKETTTSKPTTNDPATIEATTNDDKSTEPTTNDAAKTEATTNDRDTTEPTTKAILTSTPTAKCSNSGTHFIYFNVLSFFLLFIVTYLVF